MMNEPEPALQDQDTLPPWGISAFSIVHCFAWCISGVTKPVTQDPDFMAVRNSFLPSFDYFIALLLLLHIHSFFRSFSIYQLSSLAAAAAA